MRSGGYGGRENQDNSIAIGNGNDFKNKWLGLKFVVYDINTKIDNTDGNLYKARCKSSIDKNAENTIKDSSIPQWELNEYPNR